MLEADIIGVMGMGFPDNRRKADDPYRARSIATALPWRFSMFATVLVFIGGGIGSALRHGVNQAAAQFLGSGFPYGTLTVNIVGSFIMGLLAGYFAFKGEASQPWRLFLATGIVGGFTTFSAFSLDTAMIYERGQMVMALVYVLVSVGISLLALFLGLVLMRQWS
jgi:CrcB protein